MEPHEQVQNEEETEQQNPHWVKELRRKAEAYDREMPSLQRENAVLKAGIDMENPVTELFLQKSDLDWGDSEAVKAAAGKYGLIKSVEAPQPGGQPGAIPQPAVMQPSPQTPVDEHAAALQRISQASQGADPAPLTSSQDWRNATSQEEALRLYMEAGGIVNTE